MRWRRWSITLAGLTALALGAGACSGDDDDDTGPSLSCGEGTHEEGGACLPDSLTSCGEGTHEEGGACLPDSLTSCGEGTHEEDDACVPDVVLACGAGTHEEGGACVPEVACGDGTHDDRGLCFPDVLCGEGTHADGAACLPDLIICGDGTHVDEGVCVLDVGESTVVQGGTLEPPPEGDPPNGWDTESSQKVGVTEYATYDSSGDDAWDPAAHPLVFITTVGPGYGGQLADVVLPGVAIIDGATHEVVNYTAFDLGWAEYFEPHGLGVSPDGQYIYLPTGEGRSLGRILIINARTLMLEKILATRGRPHHGKSFVDPDGNQRVLLYGWEQPPFLLDPEDDNRIVASYDMNQTSMEGYLWFVDPSRTQLWGSGRWRNGNVRDEIHGNQVMIMDIATGALLETLPVNDGTPVWIDFSPDGHWAYVSGGHGSIVTRYDRTAAGGTELESEVRAGVEGPYGIRLNWDGTELYTVGKGEGSHNLGQDLGLVDTTTMGVIERAANAYLTECLRGDHATTYPDPEVNEIWLSCNSSFEVVVFDMGTKEVTDRIPLPGSTHSGSFVAYEADFSGEVLSDQNGLHGEMLEEQLARWADPL